MVVPAPNAAVVSSRTLHLKTDSRPVTGVGTGSAASQLPVTVAELEKAHCAHCSSRQAQLPVSSWRTSPSSSVNSLSSETGSAERKLHATPAELADGDSLFSRTGSASRQLNAQSVELGEEELTLLRDKLVWMSAVKRQDNSWANHSPFFSAETGSAACQIFPKRSHLQPRPTVLLSSELGCSSACIVASAELSCADSLCFSATGSAARQLGCRKDLAVHSRWRRYVLSSAGLTATAGQLAMVQQLSNGGDVLFSVATGSAVCQLSMLDRRAEAATTYPYQRRGRLVVS